MEYRYRFMVPALFALGLTACSDDPATDAPGPVSEEGSGLTRLGDRDVFVAALRDALIAQRSDQQLAYPTAELDTAAGSADSAGDGGSSAGAERSDVTQTNVQEAGVDERDRVKSDGSRLFVLESGFSDQAFPVDGVEADGLPGPDAQRTVLRMLAMDRDTPDAVPLADIDIDLDGRYADGFYLRSDVDAAIVTANGSGGYFASWGDSVAFRAQDSLIARVALSERSGAVDARLRIDGQSMASRRIGKYLFNATRFYPNIAGVSPYDVDAETWRQAVEQASEQDLLPHWTLDGNEPRALIDPADCFVAQRPEGELWYAPDIVTLTLIDLDTLEPVDSQCYLGASETLYASTDSVYLATTRWDYTIGPVDGSGVAIDPDDAVLVDEVFLQDPRVDTDIHRFDIGDGALDYVGSGSVSGHLGWNPQRKPYRMSARDGRLRIATIASRQGADVSPVIVSVLEPDGRGTLQRIAELPNAQRPASIGKPGEQLYASRFVGDRAYLVTFRQTDPLYIVDLSDPRDPAVLGELEITGYSDWLQPIGDTHLLGIGKDAVPVVDGWGDGRGGLFQGVKLSLFDVADPRAPREVQSVLIGERGTEAQALYDARAITVQPATDAHPARIAFGIDVHGDPEPDGLPSGAAARNWMPWQFTGLYAFDIRTGSDARIEQRGVLVAESAAGDERYGPLQRGDRAVIAGDVVYYVHGRDVRVARWGEFGSATGPR